MAKPSKKTIKKSTTKKSSISKVDVPKTKEKNASSNSADKLDTKKLESKATKTASQVESSKDVEDLEKKIASLENEVKILESKKTKNPKQGGFFRKFGVFFFVFLSIVSLLLLDISFWAKDTILNNQSFVSTMEPLIQNKDVQEALTINISNAIFENINVEQLLKENLPEKATFLAAPLAAQIKSFTSSEINKLLASEKAAQVWTVVLQNSQKTLVSFIENSNSSGTITVNDLYKFAGNELQGSAVSFLFNKTIPDKIGQGSWNWRYRQFESQLAYQYQRLWRNDIDDRVSNFGNSPIKDNHTLGAKFSYDFSPHVTGFIEGQVFQRNFVGDIPFLYNGVTASRLDKRYGLASVGITLHSF